MTTGELISTISLLLSAIIGLTVIITFFSSRRNSAKDDGAMRQRIETMQRDLEAAHRRIEKLECERQSIEMTLAEMKSDIKHILEMMAEMRERKP